MRILVENGRLLDPSRELDVQESLWIEDGIICEKQAFSANQADRLIDAAGGWVVPGLIDLHVHFRDPGLTYKEDIHTGAAAAAAASAACCAAAASRAAVQFAAAAA